MEYEKDTQDKLIVLYIISMGNLLLKLRLLKELISTIVSHKAGSNHTNWHKKVVKRGRFW